MTWQSFAYSFWEASVAIGFGLGLIAFFKRLLADNDFGVYMFHASVLISLSLLLRHRAAPMLVKHLIVAPTAFVPTLALSALILERIPGVRRVLK